MFLALRKKYEIQIEARGIINVRYYAMVRHYSQIISRKQFMLFLYGQNVPPRQTALQFLRTVMPNGFHFLAVTGATGTEPVLSTIFCDSRKNTQGLLRITNQYIHPTLSSVFEHPTCIWSWSIFLGLSLLLHNTHTAERSNTPRGSHQDLIKYFSAVGESFLRSSQTTRSIGRWQALLGRRSATRHITPKKSSMTNHCSTTMRALWCTAAVGFHASFVAQAVNDVIPEPDCDESMSVSVRYSSTSARLYVEADTPGERGGCMTLSHIFSHRDGKEPLYAVDPDTGERTPNATGTWLLTESLYVEDGVTLKVSCF